MKRLALAFLLASSIPAYADTGAREVVLRDGAITSICGRIGYATAIKLPRGWKVADNVMMGDSAAWGAALLAGGNVLGLKPTAEAFGTNAIVPLSNGKIINLLLKPCGSIVYQTVLTLPAEKAKPAIAPEQSPVNRRYTWSGAAPLKPVEAWDDGRLTFLRFGRNQPIPAVFATGADGKENAVNWSQTGTPGVIAIHAVTTRLVLRSGQAVGCAWNEDR